MPNCTANICSQPLLTTQNTTSLLLFISNSKWIMTQVNHIQRDSAWLYFYLIKQTQAAQSTLIPLHTHQTISDFHLVCLLIHYYYRQFSGRGHLMWKHGLSSILVPLKCLDGILLQDENNSGSRSRFESIYFSSSLRFRVEEEWCTGALQRARPHHLYQDTNLRCTRALRGFIGHTTQSKYLALIIVKYSNEYEIIQQRVPRWLYYSLACDTLRFLSSHLCVLMCFSSISAAFMRLWHSTFQIIGFLCIFF